MTSTAPLVFVIGGTGAQGIPVTRGLVQDGAYRVRALTRDPTSKRAQQLLALNKDAVTLVSGSFASESDLRSGFQGCDYAYVNIDGFNSGEKTEMFWAIRAYELALESGIKFFVYGNLDYVYKKSGYDPLLHTGHYDGKGRIGEWILQQTKDNRNRMGAALYTTGPYMEMSIAKGTPMSPTVEDGVVTWRVPMDDTGAVVHVSLEDCAYYVRWLIDHRDETSGLDLEVGIAHMTYRDVAAAFTKVTGKPSRVVVMDMDAYWRAGPMAAHAHLSSGYNADLSDAAALTMQQNFTGFWNIWRKWGGNKGVITRDYQLLDRIHPNRIRSAEEWFRREDQRGREDGTRSLWDRVNDLKPALKIMEDGRSGRL